MGIFHIFRKQNTSAKVAKERLQIIVAHQRDGRRTTAKEEPDFMDQMKKEILEVVQKYVAISPNNIEANISKEGDIDVLALNINLNELDNNENEDDSQDEQK